MVINYSRSEAEARQTQDDVAALGVRTLLCRADVSDDAAVREMVGQTVKAFGRLDILVNNAGTTHFVPFEQLDDLTDDIWDRIFAVNVKGAFYCTRAAAPHLRRPARAWWSTWRRWRRSAGSAAAWPMRHPRVR